jgi:hypothetical protein
MTAKFLASWLLVVGGAAGQNGGGGGAFQTRISQLNGGLQAEMLSLGRDAGGRNLTATVKVSNTGQDTAFVLFLDQPSAVDDAGVQFTFQELKGAAYCDVTPGRKCIGLPEVVANLVFPLQGYTEIDAGRSIIVHLKLALFHGLVSKGDHMSFTSEMAYRLVANMRDDAELSDKQKLKQVRLGNLSFERLTVKE